MSTTLGPPAVDLWPLGMRLKTREYRLITDRIDDFVEAIGAEDNAWYTDRSPWGGPICPAGALVFQPARFPDRIDYGKRMVLQTSTEWTFFQPMFPGQTVLLGWRVADRWLKRGKEHVLFEMPVATRDGRLVALCRFAEALFDPPAYDPPLPNRDDETSTALVPADGLEWGFLTRTYSIAMSECIAGREPNWHTDVDLARAKGFDRIPLLGAQLVAQLIELLTRIGGRGFLEGGSIRVNNLRPVFVDERITARAVEHRRFEAGDGTSVMELSIWCEDDSGTKVVAGSGRLRLNEQPIERIVDFG